MKFSLQLDKYYVFLFFQSRAKAATELLSELNDDVSGDFVEEVRVMMI